MKKTLFALPILLAWLLFGGISLADNEVGCSARNATAQVWDTCYSSVNSAVEAAPSNAIITIKLDNSDICGLDWDLTISDWKTLVIPITKTLSNDWHLINIEEWAQLVVNGNLTLSTISSLRSVWETIFNLREVKSWTFTYQQWAFLNNVLKIPTWEWQMILHSSNNWMNFILEYSWVDITFRNATQNPNSNYSDLVYNGYKINVILQDWHSLTVDNGWKNAYEH